MKKKELHMIPAEEKKCVWMTSGLISYKLCTHDYRCEECVFDQVIRNEASVADSPQPAEAAATAASLTGQSMPALFYHHNHCWVKVESSEDVRIGIDGILAKLLSRIKTVVLPQAGEAVSRGQCFAHVIQERHILQLVSPLSGSVLSVNQRLLKTPHLLAGDPWAEGWLAHIRPENLEHDLRTLMFGSKALEWYQKKEHEVVRSSAAVLGRETAGLGPTLQDGGQTLALASLADMLTAEQYDHVIESLSRTADPA